MESGWPLEGPDTLWTRVQAGVKRWPGQELAELELSCSVSFLVLRQGGEPVFSTPLSQPPALWQAACMNPLTMEDTGIHKLRSYGKKADSGIQLSSFSGL